MLAYNVTSSNSREIYNFLWVSMGSRHVYVVRIYCARGTLAGPMVGEERGQETEYGMQAETECEVLLKGGCTGEEGERRRLFLQNGTGQGAGKT